MGGEGGLPHRLGGESLDFDDSFGVPVDGLAINGPAIGDWGIPPSTSSTPFAEGVPFEREAVSGKELQLGLEEFGDFEQDFLEEHWLADARIRGDLLADRQQFRRDSGMARGGRAISDMQFMGERLKLAITPKIVADREPLLRSIYLDISGPVSNRTELANFAWGPIPGQQFNRLNVLFPYLPPHGQDDLKEPELHASWNDAARAIADTLVRVPALRESETGVEIRRVSRHWDTDWDRLVPSGERLELWSKAGWLTRDHGQGLQPIVHWCDAETRGILSEVHRVGRQRAAAFDHVWPTPGRRRSFTG